MKAQIQVSNPGQAMSSATLTITFMKGGQTVETMTQTLDLAPGENRQVEVMSTKAADDVSAYATSSGGGAGGYPTPVGGYPGGGSYGGGTGYGNGGSYGGGTGYGNGGSYGGGTGYGNGYGNGYGR